VYNSFLSTAFSSDNNSSLLTLWNITTTLVVGEINCL
jgi:hypothetical protein